MPQPRKRMRPSDPIARELDSIKRLLMLQLLHQGVPASDIAKAMNVVKSVVSELIPVRDLSITKKTES